MLLKKDPANGSCPNYYLINQSLLKSNERLRKYLDDWLEINRKIISKYKIKGKKRVNFHDSKNRRLTLNCI